MELSQPTAISPEEVDRVIQDLSSEFEAIFGAADVRRMVVGSMDLLEESRAGSVRKNEVEEFTRLRLRAQGRVEGTLFTGVPSVVFVCVHNAGRSQISAAWARHLAGNRLLVFSGGSAPAEIINPRAVDAMAEVGIDISEAFPMPFTDEIIQASDVVVTMGCGDACPIYPGQRYEDWQLDDPAGQGIEAVRAIRDEIEVRVRELLRELLEDGRS